MNSVITAKKIQLCIKQGLTPEEVVEKYQTSEEALKERLRQLYKEGDGTKAQMIYGQLEANRKKSHCKKKKTKKTCVNAPQPIIETEGLIITEESKLSKSLSDFQEEEKCLSNEVIQLESEHKELSGQHRSCIKELRDLQEQIDIIKNELVGCKSKYEEVVTKADTIAIQMNNISALRRDKLVVLEKVRQEIEDRSMVTITVTADGIIEAPDNPDFVINDEGFQAIKAEIAEREECLDLRVRDIATLARLIKVCEKVEHITLICDHSELEKAFWAIR